MSKLINLTGLSKAIKNIKDWVLKQRTHYLKKSDEQILYQNNLDKDNVYFRDNRDSYWYLPKGTKLPDEGMVNDYTLYSVKDNSTKRLDVNMSDDGSHEAYFAEDNGITLIDVTQLPEVYIPNTIVKTTPQTLSEDDKNQVKENLGLGEVEKASNKVKTINESSTDTQYPSAKAVYDALQNLPQGGSSTTPDWDAIEGEEGYIKNKPFGKQLIDGGYFEEEGQTSIYFDDLVNVFIAIDGEMYSDLHNGDFTNDAWPVELEFNKNDGHRLIYTGSGGEEERFSYEIYKVMQVDEELIPYTIARKSDLENIGGNDSSSVTPDWDAQEGEDGYIKNKPFYNNVDYVINKGGEYKNVHNENNVIFNNKTLFNLGDIAYGAVITINSGPPVTLEKRYESDGTTTLIINDISNYLSTYPIKIGNLVTIPEVLIPDTIARKSDLEDIGGNDSSSVTPDWDAQQGEAGYIKNKPAFVEKLQTYDITWPRDATDAPTIIEDLPTVIDMDNVMHFIAKSVSPAYPDLYFNVRINQDYTTISGMGINTFKIKIQYGDIYVIPTYKGTTQKITALKVVDLNESSLNNNVITTFKQELTEGNKNQALTNLGIDPVVWKYMCEPYHLSYKNNIPDDLRSVIFDENDKLKDIVLKLVVFEINDDDYGSFIYPAARLSGNRDAVLPSDDYIEHAVTIYPDGTTTDW